MNSHLNLEQKTTAQLIEICKKLNVSSTGNKSVLIERILHPDKYQKKKKKIKESGFTAQYFNGKNYETAKIIGNFFTENHSAKIKAGNSLEHDVAYDVQENSPFSYYKGKTINDPGIVTPCVIASCRFSKDQYEGFGLNCKNKKEVEVDLVIIHNGVVYLVELKNGCDFDTKKSKGEVQSLEATKTLCEKIGFTTVVPYICCYDANDLSDMKLKTTMGQVKTLLYKDLAEKCGLNGVESKNRIDKKIQARADENLNKLKNFVTRISNLL
ncbi:MAG: hypothetical protein CML42_06415 [Rhodobacteraceae bacterium]|nr:hypothetical protein [Paracoccaceae bacterium]|tara:strand:+ start:380 stop:1186 length:807 start_codon:yes stop_codon:yes gene_type:complete